MAHLLTDVTPILTRSFPTGKPEMSASDFDKAHKFVVGRRSGVVPLPGPRSMDYGWWAHTMIVEWRMTVEDWATGGRKGPEPSFLLCPECNVMMLLDTMQGDVLMCPGGCHRAITVQAFTQLFKPPVKPNLSPPWQPSVSGGLNNAAGTAPKASSFPAKPVVTRLDGVVPKGMRPEDYGVTEGVQKSKKPLVGWRMWRWRNLDGVYRLEALHRATDTSWLPMVPQRGTCDGEDPSEITDHVCPSWEHRCGVHAVKTHQQLKKWGIAGADRVAGEIEMWGRVLEFEEGYRAEWAYPLKLYLPVTDQGLHDEIAERLWEAYLTEVVVDDDLFKRIDNKS